MNAFPDRSGEGVRIVFADVVPEGFALAVNGETNSISVAMPIHTTFKPFLVCPSPAVHVALPSRQLP